MITLRPFQFRSITHRLITVCLLAALVIYGVSYYQMSRLVENILTGWVNQIAKSKLETLSMQTRARLDSVRNDVREAADASTLAPDGATYLLQQITARNVLIHELAIGVRQDDSWQPSAAQGSWRAQNRTRQAQALLQRCETADTDGWSERTVATPARDTLAYCLRFRGVDGSARLAAAAVDLEPTLSAMRANLKVDDSFNHLTLGHPFARTLHSATWLLGQADADGMHVRPANHGQDGLDIDLRDGGLVLTSTLPGLPLQVGLLFPPAELAQFHHQYLGLMIVSMVKDMLLMCLAIALVSRKTSGALRKLSDSTDDIARGNLDAVLPEAHGNDEVARLTRAFRRMRDALKVHIRELEETTVARQKMESELAIAAQIQLAMLPSSEAHTDARYSIATLLQAARVVGGDFYDFFPFDERRMCLVMGDVANKGVPAALFMARTISLVRTLARQASTPAELLATVNRELCQNNAECMFVTMLLAVLDLDSGELHYASAGHDAPLVLRKGRAHYLALQSGGALGLNEQARFPQLQYHLEAEDILLLYTDGITEAMDAQRQQFSEHGLLAALDLAAPTTAVGALDAVQLALQQFVDVAAQSDDVALLGLQFHAGRAASPWQLRLNGRSVTPAELKPALAQWLATQAVAEDSIDDVLLIAEEIVANIDRHGRFEHGPGLLSMDTSVGANLVKLVVRDNSIAFDPTVAPAFEADPDARAIGGLGLHLIHKLAAQMEYNRVNDVNQLQILVSCGGTPC